MIIELDSTSNFIGKGVDMGIPNDIINSPRKNKIDIGAYQFDKSNQSSIGINVNVKVFLEGPYKDGSMSTIFCKDGIIPLKDPYFNYLTIKSLPDSIVDWIVIELRTSPSSTSKVTQKAALLKFNGRIVDVDGTNSVVFSNVKSGDYYVVIKHRNHLSIMSKNPIYFLLTSTQLTDFTLSSNATYGSNAQVKLSDGIYGMYSGDGDGNGIININDYNCVSNNIFNSGYITGDFDLNSIIKCFRL